MREARGGLANASLSFPFPYLLRYQESSIERISEEKMNGKLKCKQNHLSHQSNATSWSHQMRKVQGWIKYQKKITFKSNAEIWKIRNILNPENQNPEIQNFRKSGKSEIQKIRIPENQKFEKLEFQKIRTSEIMKIRDSTNQRFKNK